MSDYWLITIAVGISVLSTLVYGLGFYNGISNVSDDKVVYSKQFAVKQGFAHYSTESGLFILDLKEVK